MLEPTQVGLNLRRDDKTCAECEVGQNRVEGGYLSITTLSTTTPATSTINFPLGDIRANNTINALDGAGRLWAIFKAPSGARTHLAVDVPGYFR